MVEELPQGYYRDNFIELVNYVYQQYEDLLSESELDFYRQFHQCDEDAQKLLVRMLTRKGQWFRQSKLNYQEISDTGQSAERLKTVGLIDIPDTFALTDILALFSKPEWLKLLADMGMDIKPLKPLKRAELDHEISRLNPQFFDFSNLECIFRLTCGDCFETFKLLFFGNLNQDLTEFVLRDLGLYRFEDYHIDKSSRLYQSRAQIELHLEYYQVTADFEQVLAGSLEDIVNLHQRLPLPLDNDTTLNRRIQRVNLNLARQLERLECLDEALKIYRKCEMPPARERQARILIKQNQIESGLALCRQMSQSPLNDEELVVGSEFGYRSAKKHKIDWPVPVKPKPLEQKLVLEQSGMGVEVDVSRYLAKSGRCFFVENGLFCSLFGLHYWQVLFAEVPGAFTNPFQVRPHDLYDSHFLSLRENEFEKAQLLLADFSEQADSLIDLWQEKFATATPFIYWDLLSRELIELALERIEQSHWEAIFSRLWADLSGNRSGFPDLILFPDEGGYELVEVKGPGDKLQKNQLRWMAYFEKHAIPHKVIYVEWA